MDSQICWIFGTTWPCLTPSEWAAWAQAVATGIGLGIAIYFPISQRRASIADRLREDRVAVVAMARALVPKLEDLRLQMVVWGHNAAFEDEEPLKVPELEPIEDIVAYREKLYLLAPADQQLHEIALRIQNANRMAKHINSEYELGMASHVKRFAAAEFQTIGESVQICIDSINACAAAANAPTSGGARRRFFS